MSYRIALASLLLLGLLASPSIAQNTGAAVDRPDAAFNLGPLGARAKIVAAPGGKGKALALTELDSGAPLDKVKAEKGDLIVAVDRRPLDGKRDPLYQLAGAIRARLVARGKHQQVALSLMRGTQRIEVAPEIEALGRNWATTQRAESFKKITRLFSAEKGGFETSFNSATSKVASAAMFGLACFADGGGPKGKHSTILRGIRGYVLGNAGKADRSSGKGPSQANWSLGFGVMFLAEYLAQRGKDKTVRKALKRMCDQLAANQEANGGWAHGPGGPNRMGYTDLSAVTTIVCAGYGAATKLGIETRADPLKRGLKYLELTAGADGTIGYSQRGGQKGMQGCGRTSIGLIAFLASGKRKHPLVAKMKTFIGANLGRLPEEHASPMYQMAFGGWGAALAGKSKEFLTLYELELLLARKHDGTFYPRPSKENVKSDYMLGKGWPAGAYLLAWSAVSTRRLSFKALR